MDQRHICQKNRWSITRINMLCVWKLTQCYDAVNCVGLTKRTWFIFPAITTTISIQPDTELVAAENDNLTIKCDHIQNGEVYHVSIEKLGAEDGSSTILATCEMQNDGVELLEHSSRGTLNCSDAMEVSLHLTSLVEDDGGLYRCNFTTDGGVQSTTVLLTTLSVHGGWLLTDVVYYNWPYIFFYVYVLRLSKLKCRKV